jgi:hypothetical protein
MKLNAQNEKWVSAFKSEQQKCTVNNRKNLQQNSIYNSAYSVIIFITFLQKELLMYIKVSINKQLISFQICFSLLSWLFQEIGWQDYLIPNVSYSNTTTWAMGWMGPFSFAMSTVTSIPHPHPEKSIVQLNLQHRWYSACWHFSFCKWLTHHHTPFFLSRCFRVIFLHFTHFLNQEQSSVTHCSLLLTC